MLPDYSIDIETFEDLNDGYYLTILVSELIGGID